MNRKLVTSLAVLCLVLVVTVTNTHLKYKKWEMISMEENIRQDAVLSLDFNYIESDNTLFYNSNELATMLVDEIKEISEDEESLDESLKLLKEICPYVEVKEGSILVPPTEKEIVTVENKQYDLLVKQLIQEAEACLGTPYVWGGTVKGKGMDCSGFTKFIYKQIGFTLPRVSYVQYKVGKLVKRNELKPGDLLFFDTTNYRDKSDIKTPESEYEYAQQMASGYVPNVISHVGLYVGNGQMIHAASGSGKVMYESINKDYYKVRFINARRLIKDE